MERARQLLVSLKSYLMAHDLTATQGPVDQDDERDSFLRNAKQVLSYWLKK